MSHCISYLLLLKIYKYHILSVLLENLSLLYPLLEFFDMIEMPFFMLISELLLIDSLLSYPYLSLYISLDSDDKPRSP